MAGQISMPPSKTCELSIPYANDCILPQKSTISFRWELTIRLLILVSLVCMGYWSMRGGFFVSQMQWTSDSSWVRHIVRPSLLWGLMGLALMAFRTLLWISYKPSVQSDSKNAPSMTVIIPAYNEGQMVENTIHSVAMAQYPKDRLEILVVDDGSRDDTWEYIQAAAGIYPDIVKAIRFSENRGKRAALEEGFRQAKGEIAVSIDSDSIIEPQTLLAIAGPFRNPKVGAVAGKVAVYNRSEGIIPRMLHVRFILSFDFLRAAQSTYGTVYCCPGALAAYRMSVVRKVLDRWLNQTFLGQPCTYGEDRALTNYIFEQGYDAVYQRTAVVHTNTPISYSRLCRMYLRWERSFIREEVRFAGIVWKRPLKARIISLFDIIITNFRYPVNYSVLALLVFISFHDPATILRVMLTIGVISALNMLYYVHSEKSWDFFYGIIYAYFAFFGLFWIFPAALFTVRSRSWMTR